MSRQEKVFLAVVSVILACAVWVGVTYQGSDLGREIAEGLRCRMYGECL